MIKEKKMDGSIMWRSETENINTNVCIIFEEYLQTHGRKLWIDLFLPVSLYTTGDNLNTNAMHSFVLFGMICLRTNRYI
jgi:hypothetical protein